MITFKQKGSFNKLEKFFKNASRIDMTKLEMYGREGVEALSAATPLDSGETAQSWSYEITRNNGGIRINWINTHVIDGAPIAVLIQYGHGTRNGGYVQGRDFINPAIAPVFEKITKELWREVTK